MSREDKPCCQRAAIARDSSPKAHLTPASVERHNQPIKNINPPEEHGNVVPLRPRDAAGQSKGADPQPGRLERVWRASRNPTERRKGGPSPAHAKVQSDLVRDHRQVRSRVDGHVQLYSSSGILQLHACHGDPNESDRSEGSLVFEVDAPRHSAAPIDADLSRIAHSGHKGRFARIGLVSQTENLA